MTTPPLPNAAFRFPDVEQIPPELRPLKRWIGFKFNWLEKQQKWDKLPFSPLEPNKQIGTIPVGTKAQDWLSHWTDFETAVAGAKEHGLHGVGFVFVKDDGYVGIDFDGCVRDGVVDFGVAVWIKTWLSHTYSEFSPSGNGIHTITKGKIPEPTGIRVPTVNGMAGSVEIYSTARFFTFTGNRMGDATEIVAHQKPIDMTWKHVTGKDPEATGGKSGDEYLPMTRARMRATYSAMLAQFRAMKRPEDFQNDQLCKCAYFCARAFLAGAFTETEPQIKQQLVAIAEASRHCPRIDETLRNGWDGGLALGAFEVLDLEKASIDALTWVDTWLSDPKLVVTRDEALINLALLKIEDYESGGRRTAAAKRLGIDKKSQLDEWVGRRRQEPEDEQTEDLVIPFRDAEPWPDPVNGAELVAEVARTVRRFIVFKHEKDAEVIAFWALGSHMFEEFPVFPRLGFTSPLPECGKTSALDVLEHFALRATRADNISTAVAFRVMEFHPTLLLDELDTFLDKNPELIGVLNSGHRKGGFVFRMEKVQEKQKLMRFPTFGPLAFGMIGHPGGTLFSRSIFIRLERKSADQKTEDFNVDEIHGLEDKLTEMRRKLARWARDNRDRVREAQPSTAGLSNRNRDNWRPLLKIAQLLGGDWSTTILTAAGVPPPRSKKTDQELLLRDLRNIFYTRSLVSNPNKKTDEEPDRIPNPVVDKLPTYLIISDLIEQHESAWYRYRNHREPIDSRALSDLMADFDIGPRAFHASKEWKKIVYGNETAGKHTLKGYLLDQLKPLFDRYLKGSPEEVDLSRNDY